MTELDICNMKYDYSEIGDMFKASKGLYTWDFTLDDHKHKVELIHSRIKGKRVISVDGKEVSSCLKYTYNYTYSFPLEGHYMTLLQISPDQYDLRIDNISFMSLSNKEKISGYNPRYHNFNNNNNNYKKRKKNNNNNLISKKNNNKIKFYNIILFYIFHLKIYIKKYYLLF